MARDSVFISYRRSDADAQAGRLAAELARRFGEEAIFFDTASISGGQAFPGRIRAALDRARVVLVLIGKGWLSARDDDSRRRIDDAQDWVHQEIAAALKLEDDAVLPVLVDDAPMPSVKALPEALAQLTERQFMRLEHAHFTSHAKEIADRISNLLDAGRLALPQTGVLVHASTSEVEATHLQRDAAWRLTREADLLESLGQHEAALRCIDDATTRYRMLAQVQQGAWKDVAWCEDRRSSLLQRLGRLKEALAATRQAAAARSQMI